MTSAAKEAIRAEVCEIGKILGRESEVSTGCAIYHHHLVQVRPSELVHPRDLPHHYLVVAALLLQTAHFVHNVHGPHRSALANDD